MSKKKNTLASKYSSIVALIGFLVVLYILKNPKGGVVLLVVIVVISLTVLAFYVNYISKRKNRFFHTNDTLHKLRSLSPTEFENYIAELFTRLGYKTERVGGGYDGGIDVIAEKDGVKHYIQCKKFITRQVTPHDVRDFYGALVSKHSNAHAFFITTNIFTLESRKFCENKPIELIDGQKLMDYIRLAGVPVPDASQAEKCPRCGGNLVDKTGKYGAFVGCSNFPNCKHTVKKPT
jgi:restriction system protein